MPRTNPHNTPEKGTKRPRYTQENSESPAKRDRVQAEKPPNNTEQQDQVEDLKPPTPRCIQLGEPLKTKQPTNLRSIHTEKKESTEKTQK